ncbi:MAG: hypothetical protein M9921_01955 [Fimbriimonadaceae bacterium]|nr:hypothetical protein [Fimbriimonadaceae bacterium]
MIRVGLGEGEVIKEWTNEGELVELGTLERLGTLDKAFAIRFASTHFPHDSVVNFKVHAEAALRDAAGVTADLVVDVEGNQRAYNRGLFLATQETYNGVYVIDPGGIAAGLARDCVDVARPRVQGMEHVVEPATSSEAQNQRQTDLDPKFKRNTVFVAITHGSPDGIRASHTDEMPWDPASNPQSITAMVHDGRGSVPLYNLVLLLACQTAYNGSFDRVSKPFGIRSVNPGPMTPDRCVVAFTTEVGTERNKETLALWTAKFLDYLGQGYTAKEAIDEVRNDNILIYPPARGASAVNPVVVGDTLTKLSGYYETSDSKGAVSAWYLVL